ncbi:unnamed protein product [Cylindrotheca closterium]|uniref:Transmembrane protein n=1 Tax=Cylindrotheca closterium TaxID=2856 RepID=A0AAD2CMV7_9STRA|nr:unnamed protein product [Cylindrotheca closterium]
MMKLQLLILAAIMAAVSALVPPAAIQINVASLQQHPGVSSTSSMQDGIQQYLNGPASSLESSTFAVSLKDRPPPPTAEELAAKKRNFNLWFWGGGFVAPFLATFYYFGFKFWER